MPRGRKPGRKKATSNVAHIFESFVGSLSALIKEKVSESVNIATTEFFNSRFAAGGAKAEEKPVRRRRRRRRRGRKPGRPAGKRGPGRPPKRGPGRPPKAKAEHVPVEDTKTE